MTPNDTIRRFLAWLLAGLLLTSGPLAATAQTGPAATGTKAKAPKPYQGPLDVIMSSHLWTDVPPTQDFVKASHPDPKTIDYTPLTGKDPERPKPRDQDGIAALQAELEQAGQMNEKKAIPLGGVASPAIPGAKPSSIKTAKRRARKAIAQVPTAAQ